jgi:hypothetical protein
MLTVPFLGAGVARQQGLVAVQDCGLGNCSLGGLGSVALDAVLVGVRSVDFIASGKAEVGHLYGDLIRDGHDEDGCNGECLVTVRNWCARRKSVVEVEAEVQLIYEGTARPWHCRK